MGTAIARRMIYIVKSVYERILYAQTGINFCRISFQYYLYFDTHENNQTFFFFGVGIGILNGILKTLLAAKPPEYCYQTAIQFILIQVFMICFFGVVTAIICAIVFSRMPRHFKGITFYLNHWGVEKRGDGIDFSTPWKKVLELKENNKFLFLYIAENAAYVFQNRMFSNTLEMEEFKSFIESKLT